MLYTTVLSTTWYKVLCSESVKTPSGPASTVTKYPTDQTQISVYFRRSEESHRHSKSQSCFCAVLIHIHSQSVTCWSTYWWQRKTPKNNNHVNSHFSSWCLLLINTGVRISDNTLFTTQCEILIPAMIQKKIQNHPAFLHVSAWQLHEKIVKSTVNYVSM